jgi:dihydroceramidase
MTPGFWGNPTSTVDWCEANYAHSFFIAEYCNTLSSLAMVSAGALGFWLHRRLLETRYLLCFASVALVGLGSIAFHATLRFELQMADELPMLYTAVIMVYILLETGGARGAGSTRPSRRFGPWFPWALAAHALLVTCLTALFRGALQFYLFHLSFGSLETFSLVGVYRLQRRHGGSSTRRLFRVGMAAYLIAIVLWYIDLKYCPLVSERLPALGLFNPQLHAVWHLLVSSGFYCLVLVAAQARPESAAPKLELSRRLGAVPALRAR